jgi:hypothetical protein
MKEKDTDTNINKKKQRCNTEKGRQERKGIRRIEERERERNTERERERERERQTDQGILKVEVSLYH